MAEDNEIEDDRVLFIATYVIKTFKFRSDRFEKFYALEENKRIINEFFDKPTATSLIFILPGSSLVVQLEFPANPKAKSCYFIRRYKEQITKETDLNKALIYGDLSYSPLEQLSGLVNEVLVPVLGNEKNHGSWPHVVSTDISQHVKNTKSALRDPKVRKMAELLEVAQSSYFPIFKEIFRDVVAALEETHDINMFLRPLRHHFEDYEQKDFDESGPLLPPMMHTVCLTWVHSTYYRSPGRIIVLLQEISNMLINQARTFLDPSDIFNADIEPGDTKDKVQKAVNVLKTFKETYEDHKAKLHSYFSGDQEPVEWEFTPKLVFPRFDKFTARLEMIIEMFGTISEFMKLERIEIGGIKGKVLSQQVLQLFEEFQTVFREFTKNTYDCLDPMNMEFVRDYKVFKEKVKDFDRRLATISCHAFDDCGTIESVFKFLAIMGSLLDRELVKLDIDNRYPLVVEMMHDELDTVKKMYDQQMALKQEGKLLLHKNMPMMSGMLRWSAEMSARISGPMTDFKQFEHPCMSGNRAKLVFTKYEEMCGLLKQLNNETYNDWIGGVDEICAFNLKQPLITRDSETNLVKVNFDPKLTAVLREVKYLEDDESKRSQKQPKMCTNITTPCGSSQQIWI
ncbi:DNAH [Mytilus coruscus]|uniref:DNAH n=1 Tax=Mytilus coruscus TaxID=42192 RepID=A0A6J8A5E9_MYTCO|nr:DNAH [Mytilus coruscus]